MEYLPARIQFNGKLVVAFVFLASCSWLAACGTSNKEPPLEPASVVDILRLESEGVIASSSVRSPLGAFVLARRGEYHCAIMFKRFWESGTATRSTVFHSGGQDLHAEYETFYRDDGISRIVAPGHKSASGSVIQKRSTGIGRLAFSQGEPFVDCGHLKLRWRYPNWVEFYPERDVELAITRIVDPEEVDFDHPRLEWFKVDQSGTREKLLVKYEKICC